MRQAEARHPRVRLALFLALLLAPVTLWAHAVLMRSAPADHASIKEGQQNLALTFNSRIDAKRSTLVLILPNHAHQTLQPEPSKEANVLSSKADFRAPGDYQVQWQVLSVDGHITRGILHFHVE